MKINNSRLWQNMAIFVATIGLIIAIFGYVTKCEAGEITWHQVNKVGIMWEAATRLVNGEPIPAGDIIKHRVFVAEPEKKDELLYIGETKAVEYEFSLPKEGKFFAGVQAIRYRLINEDLTELCGSEIAWSDTDEDTDNNPFGFVFFFKPTAPFNVRKKEVPL